MANEIPVLGLSGSEKRGSEKIQHFRHEAVMPILFIARLHA